MPLHLPTLLATLTALVALAFAAMVAFGVTQRVHRGFFAWVGACACALGGIASALAAPGAPAAWLLLLPAPLGVVLGLRRFLPRTPLPGSARLDAALVGAAAAACAAIDAWHPAVAGSALCVGSAALHLHAAVLAWRCPARRDSAALRVLAAAFGAVAVAGFAAAATGRPLVLVLATALAALLLVLLAMQFTHERTERELRDSRRRLRFLANIDMLTQVPNRRRFGELARRALQRDASGRAAMLMFDIDHFKRINDVLGHSAGDKALRLVARCVQDTLRTHDVAGRHGGDEFVLLLPGTGVREAMVVASRIAARVQDRAADTASPHISLSFGVVLTRAGESIDEALHRADLALYEAKRQGRSRVVAATGFDPAGALVHESRPLGLSSP
jgi:diguanylate cyclase (GGDEF)-like protein